MRIENKKARFDYEVVEALEAGIVLSGAETKSVKEGQVNLTGARIVERDGAFWVIGMNIVKYKYSTNPDYDPIRSRKLLVHRKEVAQIMAKKESSGLTLIPLSVYNKGALVKVEIGLVRGKKMYEKRELLKKRTEERALSRKYKL